MTHRNLGEANFARESCKRYLMCLITVAMHQNDGDRAQPFVIGRLQIGLGFGLIKRGDDVAVGVHPLHYLNDISVEWWWHLDLAHKQFGPFLIANAQRIAKAARDRKQSWRALMLKQRVGRNGGSDP